MTKLRNLLALASWSFVLGLGGVAAVTGYHIATTERPTYYCAVDGVSPAEAGGLASGKDWTPGVFRGSPVTHLEAYNIPRGRYENLPLRPPNVHTRKCELDVDRTVAQDMGYTLSSAYVDVRRPDGELLPARVVITSTDIGVDLYETHAYPVPGSGERYSAFPYRNPVFIAATVVAIMGFAGIVLKNPYAFMFTFARSNAQQKQGGC